MFGEAARADGHEFEEASLALAQPPAAPMESYDALMLMGGGMHADQDGEHPWLREERELVGSALERGTPVLGVCLGSQIVAQAAGAAVEPLAGGPEIGWHDVELDPAAADDPVIAMLPQRFRAFQWHSYGFVAPPDGTLLARNGAGAQAFRAGDRPAWGIQFHAEVDASTLAGWLADYGGDEDVRAAGVDARAIAETSRHELGRWNELGRALCRAFLRAADGSSG